ncbi:lipopolysaccharide biosynthesis protein [Colwellia echini]|uniref:Lipopolysaccharide biosynthesis protein n=1 Tax=Colwellia echini TaxID=1982103 RepID=A0ABY3MX05_9GAMM|nr:lipopolysaccharide biosynthesis protein [Colwellia echini]TYK65761.1 lipopolysaccharide biosynthesis protein [Colwellia echini]
MTDSVKDIDNRTKQGLIWYTVLPFLMHFVRIASAIWLARILSPSDFGIMGLVTVLFFYCDLFTSFGFSNAIIQRKTVNSIHYSSYFVFNIIISSGLFISFQLFSPSIAKYFSEPLLDDALKVFSIMFLLSACIAAPQANLKRNLNFKIMAIIEGTSMAISIVSSILLALNGFGFWSMIYSMILAQFVVLILTLITSRERLEFKFNGQAFKQLLNFGVWDFFWGQAVLLGENVDKLIIGKFLGTTQLGFYDKALGFAQMPNIQISRRLSQVSFSAFSRVQDDKAATSNYFTKIMALNAFICFPVFLGLSAVSRDFTLILLGDKWAPMISSLSLLSIAFLLASITAPIVSMNMAIGSIKQQTLIRFFCLIVLTVSLVMLVEEGIEAAAFVLILFYSVQLLASYYLLSYKFNWGWVKLLNLLWAPLVSAGVMYFVVSTIADSTWFELRLMNFITAISCGVVTYVALFLLIPSSSWNYLRNKVINRLMIKGERSNS